MIDAGSEDAFERHVLLVEVKSDLKVIFKEAGLEPEGV